MSAQTARERLADALEAATHRGDRVPCSGREEWISEDLDERREAAQACRPCPVSSLCHEAALEERPSWTVRAGVDWGDKAQRPARTRPEPEERTA
jgi:hypothetical protein